MAWQCPGVEQRDATSAAVDTWLARDGEALERRARTANGIPAAVDRSQPGSLSPKPGVSLRRIPRLLGYRDAQLRFSRGNRWHGLFLTGCAFLEPKDINIVR